MLKIGEFARLAKVTVKLLRHYDEVGLLPPRVIDADTGYRYYSVNQLGMLNRLLVYRSLGFSLKEIRRLVQAETSSSALCEMLEAHRAELAARIEAERARLADVEARIAQIEREGCTPRYEVVIRSIDTAVAVSLRRRCESYDEVGDLLREIRSRLSRRATIQGYGAIWHRCSTQSDAIDCEALVFLHARSLPALGDANLVALPNCTVASVVHNDDAKDVRLAYRAALDRATALGYQVSGPMRECYSTHPSAKGLVTEVQFPLDMRSTARVESVY